MRPGRLTRRFDYLIALLALLFAVGSYVDAWSRLSSNEHHATLGAWSDFGAVAVWLVLTCALGGVAVSNLSRGSRWNQALPAGYIGTLAGCAAFGVAVILDEYYQVAFGSGGGLEVLLRPTHLAEIGAGALIVAGPLQAAIRRGDLVARLPALVSAGLLISALAFATQFLSPLVDLWPAAGVNAPAASAGWWSQHLGAGSIVLEASLLAASTLLVVRSFVVRPGSLTLVCAIQGALLAILKPHWWLISAPVAAGVVADIAVVLARPSRSRPREAWLLGALTAIAFASAYIVLLAFTGGVVWDVHLSVGVVLLSGGAGWLIARVLFAVLPATPVWEEAWSRSPEQVVTAPAVKSALEAFHDLRTLATSPLTQLSWIAGTGTSAAEELRTGLQRAIADLAASPDPRDAEAGRLLIDYYLKRVGSHELVAERQHLSRPTFYRRLHRGLERVAEKMEDMAETAPERGPAEARV